MNDAKVKVTIRRPVEQKVAGPQSCPKCAGIGLVLKRVYRRRNRSVSSMVFDLDRKCPHCQGTGRQP